MYCKNCGKVIPDTARFCEHCGSPAQDTATQIDRKEKVLEENKKKNIAGIILAAFAGLCIIAIIMINGADTTSGNTNVDTTSTIATFVEISAADLYSAYDKNAVSADALYNGRELKVTGTVKDIGKDILDNIYVTLDCGEMLLFSVQCYFDDSEVAAVANLEKGQSVAVIGTCDGQTGNIIIKRCSIAE